MAPPPQRVSLYVDGFNLYYRALRALPSQTPPAGYSTLKWLDLEKLAAALLPGPSYDVQRIRYFTARVKGGTPLRQQTYLRALATLPKVTVHFGTFQREKKKRILVGPVPGGPTMVKVWNNEEKGSDVNLASHLLLDGFRRSYDAAAVITNDSDLVEPIRMVRDELGLPIEVLDPCGTAGSTHLRQVSTFHKPIRVGALIASLFPITMADGKGTFHKPTIW